MVKLAAGEGCGSDEYRDRFMRLSASLLPPLVALATVWAQAPKAAQDDPAPVPQQAAPGQAGGIKSQNIFDIRPDADTDLAGYATQLAELLDPLKRHPQLLANVSDNPADWALETQLMVANPNLVVKSAVKKKLFVMDTAHGIGGVLANEGGDELFETAALYALHHVGLINDVQLAQIVAYNPAKYALETDDVELDFDWSRLQLHGTV